MKSLSVKVSSTAVDGDMTTVALEVAFASQNPGTQRHDLREALGRVQNFVKAVSRGRDLSGEAGAEVIASTKDSLQMIDDHLELWFQILGAQVDD